MNLNFCQSAVVSIISPKIKKNIPAIETGFEIVGLFRKNIEGIKRTQTIIPWIIQKIRNLKKLFLMLSNLLSFLFLFILMNKKMPSLNDHNMMNERRIIFCDVMLFRRNAISVRIRNVSEYDRSVSLSVLKMNAGVNRVICIISDISRKQSMFIIFL